MKDLFEAGKTPIVSLFHPDAKDKTQWKEFLELADKNNYKVVNFDTLAKRYLGE
jgi:hypothetical protein